MTAGVRSKKLYYVRNKGLSTTVPRYMYYAIYSSRKPSWEKFFFEPLEIYTSVPYSHTVLDLVTAGYAGPAAKVKVS